MLEGNDNMTDKKNSEKMDNNYWRSFEDLYKDSKTVDASHHEFKTGVTDEFNPSELSHISRRKFLALVGASLHCWCRLCDYPDGARSFHTIKAEEVTLEKQVLCIDCDCMLHLGV
jgi:molybdopterin-containing oxidoreductase family iron-sulfur binding subunit